MVTDAFKKGQIMARKRQTPEHILGKLRAIEVHINSGMTSEQAARRRRRGRHIILDGLSDRLASRHGIAWVARHDG